jgi:hypothetical protein
MFEVRLPKGTDLGTVMPNGWKTVERDGRGIWWISRVLDGDCVGVVEELEDETYEIRVDETDEEGKSFWQAFGRKNPELNPFDVRFGVLYHFDKSFHLDKKPSHSKEEIQVERYTALREAYYVSFRFGDWHHQKALTALTVQRIKDNGELGQDQGFRVFMLGSLENDLSM